MKRPGAIAQGSSNRPLYAAGRRGRVRPVRARGLLSTLLVLVTLGGSAHAEGYASAVARAASARDRALETGSAHDWQEALELFAAAVELEPTVDAKFEFAEAAAHLGLDDEAFAAYEDAVALGLEGRAAERARKFLAEHASALGRLELVGPEGARVYVDGRARGRLPLARALPVMPGTRRLQLDAAGYQPFEQELVFEAERPVTLSPRLLPAPHPAPVSAKAPNARSDPREPSSGNGWALPVLVAGGGFVLLGTATIVVSSMALGNKRDELARECAVVRGDECAATTATSVSEAQSIGNEILALKTARWAGIGAAALGAGAVGLGVFGLTRASRKAKADARLELSPAGAVVRLYLQL